MGNTIDCAIISGTAQPGQEGVYPLVFNLDAYVGGLGVPNSFTLTYYRIVVNPAVGTIELSQDAFAVSQNQPNPFDESTLIELETSVSGLVQFEVFNLIGQPVHTRTVSVQKHAPFLYRKVKTRFVSKQVIFLQERICTKCPTENAAPQKEWS